MRLATMIGTPFTFKNELTISAICSVAVSLPCILSCLMLWRSLTGASQSASFQSISAKNRVRAVLLSLLCVVASFPIWRSIYTMLSFAFLANPGTCPIDSSIRRRVFMPVWAMCSDPSQQTSFYIFRLRHSFNMIWIYAQRVLTQVIENLVIRHWAILQFIRKTMSHSQSSSFVIPYLPVTRRFRSLPLPTARLEFANLIPKQLFERFNAWFRSPGLRFAFAILSRFQTCTYRSSASSPYIHTRDNGFQMFWIYAFALSAKMVHYKAVRNITVYERVRQSMGTPGSSLKECFPVTVSEASKPDPAPISLTFALVPKQLVDSFQLLGHLCLIVRFRFGRYNNPFVLVRIEQSA